MSCVVSQVHRWVRYSTVQEEGDRKCLRQKSVGQGQYLSAKKSEKMVEVRYHIWLLASWYQFEELLKYGHTYLICVFFAGNHWNSVKIVCS